ncbi:MAG: hypothetical protein F6K14_24170 [Symploca sp. SIO2C1]|nr:hypothetical protein [Symploca sp. SIO2C1]
MDTSSAIALYKALHRKRSYTKLYWDVANSIGIYEAILIEVVERWCEKNEDSNKRNYYHDGEWWTSASYKQWGEMYPALGSARKIQRIFLKLTKENYIISCQALLKSGNATKYYRVNAEAIGTLLLKGNSDDGIMPNSDDGIVPNSDDGIVPNSDDGIVPNSDDHSARFGSSIMPDLDHLYIEDQINRSDQRSDQSPLTPQGEQSVCKENSFFQEEVTERLSSSVAENSVAQKKEELNPTHQTLQRIKDSAAPIENGSRYQKNLDGSDQLPWETSKSPRQFEQGFEEWMSKSLSDYPAYQGLMNGDLITKVRKHISAGKYDFKRRDELLIEWDAYSASKEDKQLSQPLTAPLYTIRKPPSPEEEAANLLKRRIDQLNAIPEGKKMFIPKWLPGAIKNGEIPVEKVQKWMIQAMEF